VTRNILQIKLTALLVNLTPLDKSPVLAITVLLVSSYKNFSPAGQGYKVDKGVKDHKKSNDPLVSPLHATLKKDSKILSSSR